MAEEIGWKIPYKAWVTWNPCKKTTLTAQVVAFCPAGISLERMGYRNFRGTNVDVSKHHRYVVMIKTKKGLRRYQTPIKNYLEKAYLEKENERRYKGTDI
nr:MAG: hypothetical protein [uncultured cyanophage]